MKARASVLVLLGFVLTLATVLIPATVFAQEEGPTREQAALAGGIVLICVLIGLVFYVYFSLALMTIAKKTNTKDGWWAWIPILNTILMVNIAKKPGWWVLLILFVPLVNIVIAIIVWMGIAEARGKPNWWGILTIVPLVQLIVPGYLAWSD